jgi:hypothetical protein
MVDIVTNHAMYHDYTNMSTLNTYCGILSTCHNYKNKSLSLIEFFVGIIIFNQVNQVRCNQRLRNQNKNSIIRWLACNLISKWRRRMDFYKHFWKFKWRIGYGKYSSLSKINRQWRKWRALAKLLNNISFELNIMSLAVTSSRIFFFLETLYQSLLITDRLNWLLIT